VLREVWSASCSRLAALAVALPGLATACSGDATAVRLEPRVEYEIDFLPFKKSISCS
jgi:hypothetical protein